MGRWMDLLRSKGFYIALGTGIVAFASLIVMYTSYNPGEEVSGEQAIDLNQAQPVAEADTLEAEDSIAANTDTKKSDEGAKNADEEDIEQSENELANENTTENLELVDNKVQEASEPENDLSAAATAASSDSAQAMPSYNGEDAISWPVPGNILIPFSMETTVYFKTLATYKCNPGILIESVEGTSVCAAYGGVVEAISESTEYGTMLTIDMGNGYKAIYGQVMNIRVREGDTVSINQIIAEVAPASAYYTEEGCNLFFELTRDGEAINPIEFME